MKRNSFFKTVMALVLAPFLPKVSKAAKPIDEYEKKFPLVVITSKPKVTNGVSEFEHDGELYEGDLLKNESGLWKVVYTGGAWYRNMPGEIEIKSIARVIQVSPLDTRAFLFIGDGLRQLKFGNRTFGENI